MEEEKKVEKELNEALRKLRATHRFDPVSKTIVAIPRAEDQ